MLRLTVSEKSREYPDRITGATQFGGAGHPASLDHRFDPAFLTTIPWEMPFPYRGRFSLMHC
jgi:hypothetical protein